MDQLRVGYPREQRRRLAPDLFTFVVQCRFEKWFVFKGKSGFQNRNEPVRLDSLLLQRPGRKVSA